MKQKMLDGTVVPVGPHRDDIMVCSDGTECPRYEARFDCAGNAHSTDEARHDADVEIVTELLDAREKAVSEYCTENEDYASGYDCIVNEGSHGWRDRIEEWLEAEDIDFDAALVAHIIDRIDSSDCEVVYNRSEYAAYSGPGLCIDSFDIGEVEEQIGISDYPELTVLHNQGRLDDVLDDVRCEFCISRSRRRVKNEKTGSFEPVGRETYMPYGSDYPSILAYTMPGGQWHWVIPADCIREIIEQYRLELPVSISAYVLDREGYTEIVEQDGCEVTLRNNHGGLEVFAVRESYSGWCIPTDDGRVLEFCRSI